MSDFIDDPSAYPLGKQEIIDCVNELDRLAEYAFGPSDSSNAISRTTEITNSDYTYYKLARRLNHSQGIVLTNIDLVYFSPDRDQEVRKKVDEDYESWEVPGYITSISASVNEDELLVYKNLGCLTLSDGGEVDVTIFHDEDEDQLDPSDNPSTPILSDNFIVVSLIALLMHADKVN